MDPNPDSIPTLALDLGTRTGSATTRGQLSQAQTVRLATSAELKGILQNRCWDPRFERMYQHVRDTIQTENTSRVIWEDVQFVHSGQQISVWTMLRSAVWAAVASLRREGRSVILHAVPVGTLKKYATGSGSADKDAMLRAAVNRGLVQSQTQLDDNAIDAVWLLHYANHEC